MAKLDRVTQNVYGDLGNVGEFGVFGSLFNGSPTTSKDPATIQSLSNFRYGLIREVIGNRRPALEDFNGLLLLIFHQIGYIFEQGIPEWDSGTTYYLHSYVKVDGVLYVSLQNTNLNNSPESEPTWWGYFNGAVPTGAQMPYGGGIAPTDFLLCDGTAVSRTTYARLFAIIGTSYGVGDGSTTFNLPDKKGKGSIGKDSSDSDYNTVGKTGGSKTINIQHNHGALTGSTTLTAAQSGLPAHNHSVPKKNGGGVGTTAAVTLSADTATNDSPMNTGTSSAASASSGHTHSISSDLSTTQTIVQPYEVDNWIIKT